MADSFNVDLDRLHDTATSDLPYVTDGVAGAISRLNSLAADEQTAYQDTDIEGNYFSTTGADFEVVRYDLAWYLGQLRHNLEQSQAALLEIANRYREADGQPPYPS